MQCQRVQQDPIYILRLNHEEMRKLRRLCEIVECGLSGGSSIRAREELRERARNIGLFLNDCMMNTGPYRKTYETEV